MSADLLKVVEQLPGIQTHPTEKKPSKYISLLDGRPYQVDPARFKSRESFRAAMGAFAARYGKRALVRTNADGYFVQLVDR